MESIIVVILLFLSLIESKEQVPSTYTIKSSSVCYGSDPECTRHFLSCDEKTSVIGLFQAVYGFKPLGSMCRDVSACSTVDPQACCTKQKDDCEVVFKGRDMTMLYRNCSGKPECSFDAPRLTTKCSTQTYRSISVFADVKYTCVKENQLVTLGDRRTIVGDQVYVIYRQQVVSKMSDVVDCQCLVLSRNGSKVDIDIFALDIRLNSTLEPGCSAVSFIKNGEVLREMSCSSRKFYHSFEYILRTSTPLRAKVTLNRRTPPTNIWFGFRGLNGEVTLSCSYVSQSIEPDMTSTQPVFTQLDTKYTDILDLTDQKLDELIFSTTSSSREISTMSVPDNTSISPLTSQSATRTTDVSSSRNPAPLGSTANYPNSREVDASNSTNESTGSMFQSRNTSEVAIANDVLSENITNDVNQTANVISSLNDDVSTRTDNIYTNIDNVNAKSDDVYTKSEKTDVNGIQQNQDKDNHVGNLFLDNKLIMAGSLFGGCVVLIFCISAIYCYIRRRTKRESEMSEIFHIEDGDKSADHAYHVIDPNYVRDSGVSSKAQSTSSNSDISSSDQCIYSQIDDVRRQSDVVYAIPHKKRTVHSLNSVTKVNSSLPTSASTLHNDYVHVDTNTVNSDVMSEEISDDGYNHLNRDGGSDTTEHEYDSLTPKQEKSTNL